MDGGGQYRLALVGDWRRFISRSLAEILRVAERPMPTRTFIDQYVFVVVLGALAGDARESVCSEDTCDRRHVARGL